MSESSLRTLAESVLKDVLSKNIARKSLLDVDGQILAINVERFKGALKDIWGSEITEDELTKIWNDWETYILSQEKNIARHLPKEQRNQRIEELEEIKIKYPAKNGEKYFLIAKYETIKKAKGGNGELGKIIKKHIGQKAIDDKLKRIGGFDYSDKKLAGIQLGHEEAGRGIAASTFKVGRAKQLVEGNETLSKFIQEYENELKLTIDHTMFLDKDGNMKKGYVPILTWQKAIDNQSQQKYEDAAIKSLESKFRKTIAELKGSLSLKEAVGQILLFNIAGKPSKNKKVQGIAKNKVNVKSKPGSSRKRYKIKKQEGIVRGNEVGKVASLHKSKAQTTNLFSLLTLINAKLPEIVEKNMGDPALNNVTGRFAASVKATDIAITSQGFPSIGYTYNDIYRTFEVGNKQGSIERDPRRLVDSSIREIASQMAIGRFYTRRV